MRIYLAGFGNGGLVYDTDKVLPCDILESFHFMSNNIINFHRNRGTKFFLDSGAFSAFTLGAEINIDEYAGFIKEYKDIIEIASNLDAIGDVEQTYKNQKYLEKVGVEIAPVFHTRDDFKYLEQYIADGYTHIFLGGLVGCGSKYRDDWLDYVWSQYLTDNDGNPKYKIHGFGLTSLPVVFRYPWYSVDSTRWLHGGKSGAILIKRGDIYNTVYVSQESPSAKEEGRHYISMRGEEKHYIETWCESFGYTMEDIMMDYRIRNELNARVFKHIAATYEPKPLVKYKTFLFGF